MEISKIYPFSSTVSLLGRILIVVIFLGAGVNKITDYSGTLEYMNSASVPVSQVALPLAIVFLMVGGLSVLFGIKGRIGALLLVIFLIPTTYYFHQGWVDDAQQIAMLKNIGLIGGLMGIIAHGTGAFSVDSVIFKGKKK